MSSGELSAAISFRNQSYTNENYPEKYNNVVKLKKRHNSSEFVLIHLYLFIEMYKICDYMYIISLVDHSSFIFQFPNSVQLLTTLCMIKAILKMNCDLVLVHTFRWTYRLQKKINHNHNGSLNHS